MYVSVHVYVYIGRRGIRLCRHAQGAQFIIVCVYIYIYMCVRVYIYIYT